MRVQFNIQIAGEVLLQQGEGQEVTITDAAVQITNFLNGIHSGARVDQEGNGIKITTVASGYQEIKEYGVPQSMAPRREPPPTDYTGPTRLDDEPTGESGAPLKY